MSNVAIKCFSSDPNQFKTSQDKINQKRAETLYTTTETNKKNNKNDNIQVFMNPDGCLASVGGYNTNNYDLLLNLTKGKYYSAKTLLAQVGTIDCSSQTLSHCLTVDISSVSTIQPNYTNDIYEGPFLYSDPSLASLSYNSDCLPPPLNTKLAIDPSSSTICTYSFAKLISEDKLRNFDFPFKFRISKN